MPRNPNADEKQKLIKEKLSYKVKCKQWRELKVSGDIGALAHLTDRSIVTVSKAVNHGIGSIYVLRMINGYYRERMDDIPGETEYLPNDKKNRFI